MFSLQCIATESGVETSLNNKDKEIYNWIQACPDKVGMQKLLMQYAWLESNEKCYECGETTQRKFLRYDTIGPYSDGTTLICEDCWDFNCEPTPANEDGIKDCPWPKEYPTYNNISNSSAGKIRNKLSGEIIGTVTQYNERHHTGKVTLFGYEDSPEIGTLDVNCEVIFDIESIIENSVIVNINPYRTEESCL